MKERKMQGERAKLQVERVRLQGERVRLQGEKARLQGERTRLPPLCNTHSRLNHRSPLQITVKL